MFVFTCEKWRRREPLGTMRYDQRNDEALIKTCDFYSTNVIFNYYIREKRTLRKSFFEFYIKNSHTTSISIFSDTHYNDILKRVNTRTHTHNITMNDEGYE